LPVGVSVEEVKRGGRRILEAWGDLGFVSVVPANTYAIDIEEFSVPV